jgi:toxin ParE1/3/4
MTRNGGLWRARPAIAEGIYSFAESSHAIYSCADDNALGVLRILHGRMEPQGRVD